VNLRRKIKEYVAAPLSHNVVMEALSSYNRPNDKISEMIKSGELVSLRRGLYVPGPELDLPLPDSFVVANHLRGPSYISLESALSYWNLIPERVYEISSVTTKTSKIYNTAIGRFSFQHLPTPYYAFGIRSVPLTELQTALIASPEKAICDKIVLTSGILLRSVSQTMDFLIDDMRMDEEQLQNLDISAIQSWVEDAPKRSSLQMLVNTLQRL
jgi:predicted transcriptional regulator of viral defense system